jgi:hypothetical protein
VEGTLSVVSPESLRSLRPAAGHVAIASASCGFGAAVDEDTDGYSSGGKCSRESTAFSAGATEVAEGGNGNGNSKGRRAAAGDLHEGGGGQTREKAKKARKIAKKLAKAHRRAKREGRADPSVGRKACDLCGTNVDMLIRCQVDATLTWKMSCGVCWNTVSGGVVDGDASHPHYRYGGLWKNRHANRSNSGNFDQGHTHQSTVGEAR